MFFCPPLNLLSGLRYTGMAKCTMFAPPPGHRKLVYGGIWSARRSVQLT